MTSSSFGSAALRAFERPSHRVVTSPWDLGAIHGHGLNVCLWQRMLDPRLLASASAAAMFPPMDGRTRLSIAKLDVRPLIEPLPEAGERSSLARDIERLARRSASLMDAPTVDASLSIVTTDKCAKLHADYKSLRMICTYAGPGTEWVPNTAVRRSALGEP